MNIGSNARSVGRYIVDIDGSLRATDTPHVSPADIIALHGAALLGSALVWERNGETIPLSSGDRVELDDSTVFFFRTLPNRRTLKSWLADTRFGSNYPRLDLIEFQAAPRVAEIAPKMLAPGTRRAVSTTVRTSASPSAAHMARYPFVTFLWMTAGRRLRSHALFVGST